MSLFYCVRPPLYVAVAAFRQDTGRFPTAAEGLGVLVAPPVPAGGWRGPYLESATLPNDPWGRPYVYVAPAGPSHCRILSVGPDGIQGTADDVAP